MIAITAISDNNAIGLNNDLPWPKNKEDFQFFREITMNKSIVVGNNTFKHLPPLKNRYIKVLTKNEDLLNNPKFENGEYVYFFDSNDDNNILCGGAQIYNQFLPFCDILYITHIDGNFAGDTFFPHNQDEINELFPNNELVRNITGGKIVKYYK